MMQKQKKRIDYLKNFGFAGETTVIAPGINGKMDEARAAYGLLALNYVDDAIAKRREVALQYREALRNIAGITVFEDFENVKHNYSYFPILVNEELYGFSRDELYEKLKANNIFSRRYFYPLISNFSTYRELPSANKDNLPVANRIADSVICLPIHHELNFDDIIRISTIIKNAIK